MRCHPVTTIFDPVISYLTFYYIRSATMILMVALSVTDLLNLVLVVICSNNSFFRLWWVKFALKEEYVESLKNAWTQDFLADSACYGYMAA